MIPIRRKYLYIYDYRRIKVIPTKHATFSEETRICTYKTQLYLSVTVESKDDELIALIGRCALRDQLALKSLYDRVSPFLNGVAYRILGSDDLSNDVLQEAFIQIWNNASSYRVDKAKPMTWMCSIVR